ncbi:MAG: Cof-type HAD-IIB family hydrolase [Eubacterium sp.]|nr:Cof-type HAD-IIB family hydrolase [Eubacterium sp.]
MAYEVLVLDVDGTLVNSKKEITEPVRRAIWECQEKGIYVVVASGRCTHGIRHQAKAIGLDHFGGYVLSYNGAHIENFATGEVVFDTKLPEGMIHELYDYAMEEGAGILTYHQGKIIATDENDPYVILDRDGCDIPVVQPEDFHRDVDFNVNKVIFTGDPDMLKELEKEAAARYQGVMSVYRSEPFYLEFMPLGIDKSYGIAKMIESLGYKRSQVICCGDGFNDVGMIEYAGLGVAMGNASAEVRSRADYVAPTCDEDGLVHVIEKFITL